jgi:glycosyltransferase involved in cell wall biosynthesis
MPGEECVDELLPRLAYLGDVPVESSHHGAALLFRLLERYPAEKLRIIEGNLVRSTAGLRLPNVQYSFIHTGTKRFLNSRFHSSYSAWLMCTAAYRVNEAVQRLRSFKTDAILTVAHGYSWITAAALARRLGAALHIVVHDDWPRVAGVSRRYENRLDRLFGDIYRSAASRLCVSPLMAEDYFVRYGVKGDVLYPSRSADCPKYEDISPRVGSPSEPFVVAYGGNSNPDVMDCLADLAFGLESVNGELHVCGPFSPNQQRALRAISSRVVFYGFLPYAEMINRFRGAADLLFVGISFEDRLRQYMGFPSKLADYTAIGIPILVYAPQRSSVVRWVRDNPDSAAVVDRKSRTELTSSLQQLKADPRKRIKLARHALDAGENYFSHDALQRCLFRVLNRHD